MDADLLEAYRAGERHALTHIYQKYAHRVRRDLARRPGLSADDLADVLQEIFIHAFSDAVRARYDGARAFGPFLHVIARNVFLDLMRRPRREVAVASDVIEAALNAHGDESEVSPSLVAMRVEAVAHYVRALPSDLRCVYEQRFLRTRTQHQAAATLGLSRQALRTRERRLIEEVRRELGRFELAVYE